jgi:hypothetical protein
MGANSEEPTMKKKAPILAILLLLLTPSLAPRAHAVSYSPIPEQREEKAAKGIREKGEEVCLFHSGTEDVRKAINVHDVLVVFREGPKHELSEVGKVKVLSYVGEDYIKGVVVEGEVQTGDIAKKGDVASLIISSGDKCK